MKNNKNENNYNNNNNNDDPLLDIQLNPIIFKELSIDLIYNSTFEEILEYSLISKSTFKHFQNLISNQINKNKFILPTAYQFIKYISHNNNDKNNNNKDEQDKTYNNKLIQYKDIEEIRFSKIIGNERGDEIQNFNQTICDTVEELLQDYEDPEEKENQIQYKQDKNCEDYDYLFYQLYSVKNYLNKYCTELKRVVLIDKVEAFTDLSFDFTFNGFYKVKRLVLNWSISNPPISNGQEKKEFQKVSKGNESKFMFSFKFLHNYKPSKIYYTSRSGNGKSMILDKLDNILLCSSIKSIDFQDHYVTGKFIEQILQRTSPPIKSLVIKPKDINEMSDIYSSLRKGGLTKPNSTLKKLIFKNDPTQLVAANHFENEKPVELFKMLKLNKSLSAIGLESFNITNSKSLTTLFQCTNITKLYCGTIDLRAALYHCNQNSNITELQFTYEEVDDDGDFDGDYEPQDIIKAFKNFFKSNTSQLKTIKIQRLDLDTREINNLMKLNSLKGDGHPNLLISDIYTYY